MRRRRRLYFLAALAAVLVGIFLLSEARLPVTATLEPGGGKAAAQGERESASGEATDAGLPVEREAREEERQEDAPESPSGQEEAEKAVPDQRPAGVPTEEGMSGRFVTQTQYVDDTVAEEPEAQVAEQISVERALTGQSSVEQQYERQHAAPSPQEPVAVGDVSAESEAAGDLPVEHIEPAAPQEPRPVRPASTALTLTVPGIGLYGAPVANSISEGVLANGAGKIPSTGFPWQPGANTYIAGHVYGYPGTGSWQLFAGLTSLVAGDRILLTDSAGTVYEYRVAEILRVAPTDVWVTRSTGQSMVSLQTCVGPGWSERLIVRAVRN